jgi:biopolymer transport protein ExbB
MQWDLIGMWKAMGPLARGVVVILFIMLGISIVVMIDRFLRYRLARNHTRAFVQQVADAMRLGNLDQAISIAERNKKSPIAQIVATGLMPPPPCRTRRSWRWPSAACNGPQPSCTPN